MTDPGPVEPRPSSAVPTGPSPWAAPSPWAPPERQSQPDPAAPTGGQAPADPTAPAAPSYPQASSAPAVADATAQAGPGGPVQQTGPPYQVPPGPGAVPPFAAPPVEGRTARVWIGLSVAALALLLCCGGGTVALVGLLVTGSEALNEQAQATVDDYFAAVSQQDFTAAYRMLCADAQRGETADEFAERLSEQPEVDSYSVGQATITNPIVVPVEVTYTDGGGDTLRVTLNQDTGTGELEVCGIEE